MSRILLIKVDPELRTCWIAIESKGRSRRLVSSVGVFKAATRRFIDN